MTEQIKKTIDALRRNRMTPYYVETAKDALIKVKELLAEGSVVTHGGSVTLQEVGAIDLLKSGAYQYLDRTAVPDPRQVYLRTFDADTYLTGTNAITENGELYNVDGNGNRVSAICFGPRQVIVIAGVNKIVKDLPAAVHRVKTVAAPKNTRRLGCDTYCAKTGQCVALQKEKYVAGDGCSSPQRICAHHLISAFQRDEHRIKVILVGETLGY